MSFKPSSQSVTSQSGPPPQIAAAYDQLINRARGITGQNPRAYTGPMVAGFNPMQQQAFQEIQRSQGMASPYINAAAQMFGQANTPFYQTVGKYESPYTSAVTRSLQGLFKQQNAQQQQQVQGNAVSGGAYGGDRQAVAQALTAQQQNLSEMPTLANVLQGGYQTALGAAESQGWLGEQGGFGLGALGQEAQSTALQGANALLGAGGMQQGLAQEQLNIPYQQFQMSQAAPYQNLNEYAAILEGLGSLSGGQGQTNYPGPSPFSQLLGGGLGAAGLIGLTGGFGPSGWLTGGKHGGRTGYQDGGMILPSVPVMSLDYIAPANPSTRGSGPPAAPSPPGQQQSPITQGLGMLTAMKPLMNGSGGWGGGAPEGFLTPGTSTPLNVGSPAGSAAEAIDLSGASAIDAAAWKRGGRAAYQDGGMMSSTAAPTQGGPGLASQPGIAMGSAGPGPASYIQRFMQMPMDQLQAYATRFPPNSPMGSMVQRALQTRRMNPSAGPGQVSGAGGTPIGTGMGTVPTGMQPQPTAGLGTATSMAAGGAAPQQIRDQPDMDQQPIVDHTGPTVVIHYPSEGKSLDLGIPSSSTMRGRHALGGRTKLAAGGGGGLVPDRGMPGFDFKPTGEGIAMPQMNSSIFASVPGEAGGFQPGGGMGRWFNPMPQYHPPGTQMIDGQLRFPSVELFSPGMRFLQNMGEQSSSSMLGMTGMQAGGMTGDEPDQRSHAHDVVPGTEEDQPPLSGDVPPMPFGDLGPASVVGVGRLPAGPVRPLMARDDAGKEAAASRAAAGSPFPTPAPLSPPGSTPRLLLAPQTVPFEPFGGATPTTRGQGLGATTQLPKAREAPVSHPAATPPSPEDAAFRTLMDLRAGNTPRVQPAAHPDFDTAPAPGVHPDFDTAPLGQPFNPLAFQPTRIGPMGGGAATPGQPFNPLAFQPTRTGPMGGGAAAAPAEHPDFGTLPTATGEPEPTEQPPLPGRKPTPVSRETTTARTLNLQELNRVNPQPDFGQLPAARTGAPESYAAAPLSREAGAWNTDPRGLSAYIAQSAQKYGVDPNVALRVAMSEGLGKYEGDQGTSFGAFQLHIGGGEGDRFQRETGRDPRDPANEHAMIDWTMRNVAQTGWGPYHGARLVGIGPWQGIQRGSVVPASYEGGDQILQAGDPGSLQAQTHAIAGRALANTPPEHRGAMAKWMDSPWFPVFLAGAGIMASRSPFPGVAIGEGMMQAAKGIEGGAAMENKQELAEARMGYMNELAGVRQQQAATAEGRVALQAQLGWANIDVKQANLQREREVLDAKIMANQATEEERRRADALRAEIAVMQDEAKKPLPITNAAGPNGEAGTYLVPHGAQGDPSQWKFIPSAKQPSEMTEADYAKALMSTIKELGLDYEGDPNAAIQKAQHALSAAGINPPGRGGAQRPTASATSPATAGAPAQPAWAVGAGGMYNGKPIFPTKAGWFYMNPDSSQGAVAQ